MCVCVCVWCVCVCMCVCARVYVRVRLISGASWLSGSVRDVQARDRGFDPRLCRICSDDVVLLGKALCSHVHSLDPGVSGYLVGQ